MAAGKEYCVLKHLRKILEKCDAIYHYFLGQFPISNYSDLTGSKTPI